MTVPLNLGDDQMMDLASTSMTDDTHKFLMVATYANFQLAGDGSMFFGLESGVTIDDTVASLANSSNAMIRERFSAFAI